MIVDLSAGVRLDRDLIDPNIEELMEQDPTRFGSIERFGLNELLVSALGAVAKGSGDFTFDMNDLQTLTACPPEGEASIVVSGLNSVFDQLIEAGLLQPDQMLPIRMGLGMGFVATGEDELTSEVEVRSTAAFTLTVNACAKASITQGGQAHACRLKPAITATTCPVT